tara:strand:+ start:1086 stop:1757 length:672 start_codon:yes stop_codon:yes gene_type:complete
MKISIIPDILSEEDEDMIKIRIEDNDEFPIEEEESDNIKVAIVPNQDPNIIRIEIVNPNEEKLIFSMQARRALNGDIMIFDHKDIDIVLMPEKSKVVAFAKDIMSEIVYGAESRLMEYLRRVGIIEYDSIQGGNVYGSLEGKIHKSKDLDALKVTIYQISEWLNTEKPIMAASEAHDDMFKDRLLDPDAEKSTELGEVPHEEEKGSIDNFGVFSPYWTGRYTY